MVKLGIIGLSEANGHPFSFSAIINGYNEVEFAKTEWLGILQYLKKRHESEIASLGATVTHVWTQDPSISRQISNACYVEHVVDNYEEMIGEVDAVVIARDDYSNHLEMSRPFLEKGIPVFVDKPLTLVMDEFKWFLPYIQSGLLMTCSGFRFSKELDDIRGNLEAFGKIKMISAKIINQWEKYGIHMIDALLGLKQFNPVSVESNFSLPHDSMTIELKDGTYVQIDALGPDVITFSFDIYGTALCEKFEIRDNFSAFKRCMFHFINQVKTGKPSIDPKSVELSILTLIAGSKSKELGKKIFLDDLKIT